VGRRYTFGDDDVAVRRMGLVARVFEATSRALLGRAAAALGEPPGRAVDLGCGPGHTTRLIAEVVRPRRVVGLDVSDRYVSVARAATEDPAVGYARHDATAVPFPGGRADLIHARLLLAHLPDPPGLVAAWRGQLRPGGVLVVDEVERIGAPPGVLRAYEDLVTALVAAEGGPMAAGPLLAPLGGTCVPVPVDGAVAARIFALNLAAWGDDAVARELASSGEVAGIAAGLDALAAGPPGGPTVDWVLRQLVLPETG
jgi:trans-aconitate 2-methyltransferase